MVSAAHGPDEYLEGRGVELHHIFRGGELTRKRYGADLIYRQRRDCAGTSFCRQLFRRIQKRGDDLR